MSRNTKIFVAIAAIGGGAAYWYNKNLDQVEPLRVQYEDDAREARGNLREKIQEERERLERKKREAREKLHEASDETKKLWGETRKTALTSLRDSTINPIGSPNLDDEFHERERFGPRVAEVRQKVVEKPKSALFGLGDAYIDAVNSAGDKVKSTFGTAQEKTQTPTEQFKEEKNSWFNWFEDKTDEAKKQTDRGVDKALNVAEDQKNSWLSWGKKVRDDTKDTAQANVDQLKQKNAEVANSVRDRSRDVENWSIQKKDEVAQNATDTTNRLKAQAKDLANSANEKLEDTKDSWLSWSSQKKEEGKELADEASDKLEDKKDSWLSWGSQKKNEGKDALVSAGDKADETKDSVSFGDLARKSK